MARRLSPAEPRITAATRMKILLGIFCPCAFLALLGCHQGTNPSVPLAPVNPLVGATRVAPPGTGSFVVPDAYSGGTPTASTDQSAVGSPSLALSSVSSPNEQASGASNGVRFAGGSTPMAASGMGTNASGDFKATSGIQPAGYSASIPSNGMQLSSASALQLSGSVDPASSSPAMRGMQVVDLTNPEAAKPVITNTPNPLGESMGPSNAPSASQTNDLNWRQPF